LDPKQELLIFIYHYQNIHNDLNKWVDEKFAQLIPTPMADPNSLKEELKKMVAGIYVHELFNPS
jgi:hypothetical protein